MNSFDHIKNLLNKLNQPELLKFYNEISIDEQKNLLSEIENFDLLSYSKIYQQSVFGNKSNGKIDATMEPIPTDSFGSMSRGNEEDKVLWEKAGLQCISEGKLAVLVLAGGQGTRLGVSYPKGMFDVGIPSGKTLYHVNAEKIQRLQNFAFEKTGKSGVITWYIMTSETTMDATRNFFQKHDYFGLEEKNVKFFEQFTLPCTDFNGKILLLQKHKIACAPDGNGGLYKALRKCKILDDMERRGIECVHVHCVDNILQKTADPVFVGFCRMRNAECGAKVVEKTEPNEAVGVVCKVDGVYQVVEYSEISEETSKRRDSHGRLVFHAGNICNHFFSIEFLKEICKPDVDLPHHVAKKKIPHIDSNGEKVKPCTPNGTKMEKFVFDVFKFAKPGKFVVFEVLREDEFSPLKNAEGAKSCSPLQARWSLASLHHRQIVAAGGMIVDEQGKEIIPLTGVENYDGEYPVKIEISPLLSYGGENLEQFVKGRKLRSPVILKEEKIVKNGDA